MTNIVGEINGSRLSYDVNHGYLYFTGSFKDSVRLGLTSFTTALGVYSDVIVKIDQTGQFIWAKKTGHRPSVQNFASSITANNFGFILFSGFTDSVVLGIHTLYSNGSLDNLITQYDFDGNIIYYKNFGGSSQEIPKDVYSFGNITYFIGRTMSNYMIDSFNIFNVSFGDILIAKMKDTTSVSSINEYLTKKDFDFQLYPNPFSNEINIEMQKQNAKQVAISIQNVLGQVVYISSDANLFSQRSIDLKYLPSGFYFLNLQIDGEQIIRKLVKQ